MSSLLLKGGKSRIQSNNLEILYFRVDHIVLQHIQHLQCWVSVSLQRKTVQWTWFTTWETSSQYNSSSTQQQLGQSHCASQLISVWLYFVIKMVCFYTLKSASIVEQALTCSLGCGTIQLSAISVPNPRVIFTSFGLSTKFQNFLPSELVAQSR